jgi:hypothetical protein
MKAIINQTLKTALKIDEKVKQASANIDLNSILKSSIKKPDKPRNSQRKCVKNLLNRRPSKPFPIIVSSIN